MKKKVFAIALSLLMTAGLCACGSSTGTATKAAAAGTTAAAAKAAATTAAPAATKAAAGGSSTELTVFAAASMTETLNTIKGMFEKANPGVTVTYNFDSSGTLKTQIQNGADCDLFISAGQKQMNELDSSKDKDSNPDGLDFVEQGTRVNILENKVTLVVPKDNKKGIKNFDDMAAKLKDGSILLAMGNSDVPVGQYTQKILKYYKLDEAALASAGTVTYGSNVKEVTTQVSEGSVDCGVIYATDAFSAGLTVVDSATKDMCGQVIYPAAVMKNGKNQDAAKKFLDYLKTDEAGKVFEKVGFTVVK